ncbi:FAD-dependent monooxygenase [Hansschlegelia sp. KR7-227]|uniref:FAD-dependent monooxygenase n=1 Tax=Hansschlegelia sp. KR7-227 TaxID=3400914 RepID=UPI003C0A5F95
MSTPALGPALIAGAGPGGLTLALALARRGVASRLVERAAMLEETGAGVQLSANAGRVLDALGLGPALDAVSTRPEAVSIADAPSGRTLKTLPFGRAAERRWGAPYRVIHRADLQEALLEAIASESAIDLILGTEVKDARETDDGVALDVATADGPAAIEGGWLAGADGLRSVVRRALKLPTGVRGRGLVAWRAVTPAAALPKTFKSLNVTIWMGPGAHLVVYPLRKGREANVVVIGDERASGAPEIVASWAQPARDLVGAATHWTPWPLFDRPPDARLRRGRIALIGDAAHAALPTLAQGAAFAIEDAATLARLVAAEGPDPLGAYEAARLMRAARMQVQARRQIEINHMAGMRARARNAALMLAPTSALLRRYDWIYGWKDAA